MAQQWNGAVVLGAAAFSCAVSASAPACDTAPPGARRVESSRYLLYYRMNPAKPEASKHFAVDLTVCPKAGAPRPEAVRVDATMPAHGHGMNYRVDVVPRGSSRFEARGLMFHMPGRWELVFEVCGGDNWDRATHEFML